MATRERPNYKIAERPWYALPFEDQGGEIKRLIKGYRTSQQARRATYIRNLEAYEGRTMGGYYAHAYCETDGGSSYKNQRLRLIRSAVSSAVSNVYAPQKPKPQFQTLGATWALRRKAYKLDKICEGIMNQRQGRWINVWAMLIDAGVEAALQGTAAIMVSADYTKKRIVHDLIPHVDIFTDPVQGRTPVDWFLDRPMSLEEAIGKYGRSKRAREAIMSAPPFEWWEQASTTRPRASKVIKVSYAWHIGDGEDNPGTWAIEANGVTLDGDEWTAPAPPLAFLQWEPHRDGPWASGIADEGLAMAEQADELDLRLYLRELIASGEKIFYRRDSLNPQDLTVNDAVVAIPVEPGAEMPVFTTPAPFNPMELQFRDAKVRDFWDGIGISQVSAAARREQGVSSGVAIRTLNDTKAGRQLVKAQRYEQCSVDLAHQYVWRLRELAENEPKLVVQWAGKSLIREYHWKDAEIEDDTFSVTVAPASALPHDPAGRQEMVQELFKSGLISQETTKQLMGWPDFDAELQVENAETEYLDMLIERYLDADPEKWGAGDYQAPEGFVLNKVGAIRRFASAWFRARIDQASLPTKKERAKVDFNLKLLTRYIREMDALMQPPPAPPVDAAAPAQPAAPPPGPPGAVASPMPNQQLPAPGPLAMPQGIAPAA